MKHFRKHAIKSENNRIWLFFYGRNHLVQQNVATDFTPQLLDPLPIALRRSYAKKL
jgi:hypothetical protein